VQGFSTGLPERLQLALLHTLPGAMCPTQPPPHHIPVDHQAAQTFTPIKGAE
jgi:hypothetical protein